MPFDSSYQPLFVTLISTLVSLGQKPRCVLEIQEQGAGRLSRILQLLDGCAASIHDLSRQSVPSRFNMPFELGLACALSFRGRNHQVVVLDAKPYRLDKVFSDYKGHDPLIHHKKCDSLITCLLDIYDIPGEPSLKALCASAKVLRKVARQLCRQYKTENVYRPSVYRALVAAATRDAQERGYIRA